MEQRFLWGLLADRLPYLHKTPVETQRTPSAKAHVNRYKSNQIQDAEPRCAMRSRNLGCRQAGISHTVKTKIIPPENPIELFLQKRMSDRKRKPRNAVLHRIGPQQARNAICGTFRWSITVRLDYANTIVQVY